MMTQTPLINPLSKRIYSSDSSVYTSRVEQMYSSYHSSSLSYLQDCISFAEESDYLKRFYEEYEFSNKIIMLSQYYQYHRELPRIFQPDITQIIQIYQEDVRNLEYKMVTRKLKDDVPGQGITTNRQKSCRPVEKIIKNIELSYYNFQNKEIKKQKIHQHKDKGSKSTGQLIKAKKSMPNLKFYQYVHDPTAKTTHQKPIVIHQNQPSHQHPALKIKDINKPSKSKPKDSYKKISLNNSIESHKNLSRSKSKSNLPTFQADAGLKRNSVRPFPEPVINKTDKIKSNPNSLQKTCSTKNILQKRQQNRKPTAPKAAIEKPIEDKLGMKNMFKKVMQTKKVIKITR